MKIFLAILLATAVASQSISKSASKGPRVAVADIRGAQSASRIRGKLYFEQASPSSPVKIRGEVEGLPPGYHGMHIHEGGDIDEQCMNVGLHFNPEGYRHGGPTDPVRHAGDLGNIVAKGRAGAPSDTHASFSLINDKISLFQGSMNVMNRAVVIHLRPDDLGRGANKESLVTGNAGGHLACAVIQLADESAIESGRGKAYGAPWGREFLGKEEEPVFPRRSIISDMESEKWEKKGRKSFWDEEESPIARESLVGGQVPSNLELEGVDNPDYTESNVPTETSPVPTSTIWKAGNLYEYDYEGSISTGMPSISPQLSGGIIKARICVEPKDESTLVVAVTRTKAKLFNEPVLEKWQEADPGQEIRVVDKEHIEKPILVKIINGKVESVGISREEPLWTVNFKRAIVAQLQLQLDENSAVITEPEAKEFYKTNAVYAVMEGCTTGECQTYYQLTRVPEAEVEANPELVPAPELCSSGNVYEIVKNRDFDKCKVLPVFNYISLRGLKCNMAELGTCENMISRVDLSRMIGCVANDGSFVVQKIVTTDKLIHKPFGYETEPLEGISMQRFSLRAIRPSGSAGVATKLPGDLEIYKTLVYAYDEELKVHGPYLKKPSLRDIETPIVQLPRKDAIIKEIDRLFSEVVKTLESDEYYVDPVGTFVPEKMNMMKAAMMYLNYDELKSLAARYIGPKFSTANQVFVDTLTYCGTNPAIMVLKDLIISNRINTELIVNSIALLPATVKTPTKELLSDLIDFMQSSAIMQDRRLKIALALSISRLVDQACVNTTDAFTTFPEMVMGQFCTPYSDVVVNNLIPVLVEELNNADDEEEKIAMLAALGNLGHEAIIPAVLPYVSSCDPSTEEEYSWYERERRSVKDESPAAKKALRKKWLTFKRGKSKQEKQALRKLEKERDEEEEWGMSPLEAKLGAKDMKAKNKIAASKRKDEMTIRAWELQEKRLEDMEKAQEKQLKHKSKIAKKAKSGWASRGPAEAEEEEEEEEEEAGFMGDQPWSRTMGADLESVGIEEEYEEEEEDQALCNIVRMKAVYALSKLAKEKNEAVLPILMPISSNKDEDTEVRLAALSLLFVHNLPAGFWARVAASTWFEPNDHVATFIYTTLANLAKNKDPMNRDAAKKAEAVIAMVKPNRWAPHISTAFINGELQERTRLGYNLKSFSFGGHESFLPSNHYTNFILRLGPWAANILEVSVNGVHMEKFIDQWIGAPTRRWKASGVYGGTASKVLAHPELSKIHQELKIEARAKGSPEMFIYINHMDNYQRFFSIDRSNFNEILNRLVRPQGLRGPTGKHNLNYHNYFPIIDKMTRVPSAMGLAYGVFKHHKFVTNVKTSMSGSMDLGASTGVQGIIQSALAMKLHAKMTVETPFARAIPTCGVDITTRTTLPGKFKIEGDYKNGKVEAAWKFLGRRTRLGFYSVAPFITIRDVDDFTPSMLIKGTKPIALLDTLKQSTTSYGARATGLNFVYQERHDAKALNTPLAFSKEPLGTAALLFFPSTLRFCEHSLYLDLTKSDTKAVKLHLAISAKHQDQIKSFQKSRNIMEEGLFKGLYGKKIKSGRFLEEDPEDEWTQHKFSNLFEKLEQNPYGFTVDASVAFVTGQSSAESEWPSDSAKAIRFGTSLVSGFDQLGIRHRTHFMLEKEFEEDPDANFVMCVEGNINWPAVLAIKREKLLTKEVSTTAGLNIAFGNSCNDRKISIMTEFKNTDKAEYTRIPEVGLEQLRCLADELKGKGAGEECVNTERLANILNKFTVTIKHNEMPAALRNFTHKAENALRHWLGAHLSDNRVGVQNEKGQIKIEAIYHPIIGTMDIRTFKPESNTFFHNLEVTPIAEAVIPFHPTLTAYRAAFRGPGICVVDEDTVTTYDGVNYNVSLSSCDHVVTKDCSGRYKMAVLAREEANSKIVTVLLNKEKIELNPVSRQVRINGQVKSLGASEDVHRVIDDLNQIIATVRQTRDGFLEVSSPTHWIRVTAGPREVLVMGSAVHRGHLCGLCGTQSGDKTDDLTGPMKCSIPADLMDVAYQLNRPAGCQKSSLMAKEVSELRNIQRTCKTEEENYSALERISNKYETRLGVPFVEDWEKTGRSRFSYPDMEKWEHNIFAANKFEGRWGMRSSADRNPFLQAKSLGCSLVRNKVSTQGALKCFSTVPVTKCAAGCKPVSVITKKVGFHCVAKTSLAEHLIQEALRRPLDELVNKEISMVADVKVPTACVPAGVSSLL